jgi:hypothetical protein
VSKTISFVLSYSVDIDDGFRSRDGRVVVTGSLLGLSIAISTVMAIPTAVAESIAVVGRDTLVAFLVVARSVGISGCRIAKSVVVARWSGTGSFNEPPIFVSDPFRDKKLGFEMPAVQSVFLLVSFVTMDEGAGVSV